MFAQYKEFFDIVFVGTLLSLAVFFVIRGLMNGHFKNPLIVDDPEPQAEIIILDDYRNNKNIDVGKKYIFIDKDWDVYKNRIS